jgi:hypothetical protein
MAVPPCCMALAVFCAIGATVSAVWVMGAVPLSRGLC